MFGDNDNLEQIIGLENWKSSVNITDMESFIYGCYKLTNLDIHNLSTSTIETSTTYLVRSATSLKTLKIGKINVFYGYKTFDKIKNLEDVYLGYNTEEFNQLYTYTTDYRYNYGNLSNCLVHLIDGNTFKLVDINIPVR